MDWFASRTGTDPRLGIKGPTCGTVGVDVVPIGAVASRLVSCSRQRRCGGTAVWVGQRSRPWGSAKTLRVDDGMILAMQYLNLAVKIAAGKGIKLPDTDSIRAGLVSESVAKGALEQRGPLAWL